VSKTQLKKQVVQFYWQNLIQSYGVESKSGFKLDVKGKTINSNTGSSLTATTAPYLNQGSGGSHSSGVFNQGHYAMLSQQAQQAKPQFFSEH